MAINWEPDSSFAEDAEFSRSAFLKSWPVIQHLFGPGATYRPVEDGDVTAPHQDLDLIGGIDGYITQKRVVRTVAQRTQRLKTYERANTFTIRAIRHTGAATELRKRLEAIETESAVPSLTIQVYFDEHRQHPIRVGIAHTVALYRWVVAHPEAYHMQTARHGGNAFLVVKWWTLGLKSDVPYATWYETSRTRGPRAFFDRPTWPKDYWI
jgi:hypothetical protein